MQVNGSGQLIRDGLGNLVYEKDGSNNPILVTVADPYRPRRERPARNGERHDLRSGAVDRVATC